MPTRDTRTHAGRESRHRHIGHSTHPAARAELLEFVPVAIFRLDVRSHRLHGVVQRVLLALHGDPLRKRHRRAHAHGEPGRASHELPAARLAAPFDRLRVLPHPDGIPSFVRCSGVDERRLLLVDDARRVVRAFRARRFGQPHAYRLFDVLVDRHLFRGRHSTRVHTHVAVPFGGFDVRRLDVHHRLYTRLRDG